MSSARTAMDVSISSGMTATGLRVSEDILVKLGYMTTSIRLSYLYLDANKTPVPVTATASSWNASTVSRCKGMQVNDDSGTMRCPTSTCNGHCVPFLRTVASITPPLEVVGLCILPLSKTIERTDSRFPFRLRAEVESSISLWTDTRHSEGCNNAGVASTTSAACNTAPSGATTR
jgi:hypothetical protein